MLPRCWAFLERVMTIVGLYILLGLGLNIVVGFAGLLDLDMWPFLPSDPIR